MLSDLLTHANGNRVEINPGDYVSISASRYPFAFVLGNGGEDDWVYRISQTLNWNSRSKQKAFKEEVDINAVGLDESKDTTHKISRHDV